MSRQAWESDPEALPLSRYLARRWVVSERAWREVCGEHGLDCDARSAALIGASTFCHLQMAEFMAELALTDAECEPWAGLPGSRREMPAPPTVESVRRQYAEILAEQAERHQPA